MQQLTALHTFLSLTLYILFILFVAVSRSSRVSSFGSSAEINSKSISRRIPSLAGRSARVQMQQIVSPAAAD